MTQVFAHFSNIIIPVIIFYIVAYGITVRTNVYEEFIKGAKDGFHTVIQMLIKMFSSSAATGLVLDIFKNHGPDSLIGMTTSIMMSCTETVFYTMSVYYMAARVTKTRYTLAGAVLSTITGVVASIVLAGMMR